MESQLSEHLELAFPFDLYFIRYIVCFSAPFSALLLYFFWFVFALGPNPALLGTYS